MSKKKTLIISLAILIAAGIIITIIFLTEPSAERTGATKETAMLVNVVKADSGTFRPTIVATGTVEPARDIMLSSRVNGKIIRVSESFTPGGFVKEGEVLIQIDPADYRNNLKLRESELQQALANLKIEQGRQDVARQDYELFDDTLAEENKALVLREPQLESVQATVDAARAAVNQAQINLNRTTIRAPFDARIINRNVNVGSQVNIGNNLARLIGTNNYWLSVTIPLDKLPFLSVPDDPDEMGAMVRIINPSGWPDSVYREGYLFQMVGNLEEQTRMARVLVRIPDPLNAKTGSAELPELIIGSFLQAEIAAEPLKGVVRLNRDFLRENETVWVMQDEQLDIRKVKVEFTDENYAYISEGIHQEERIVTTNIATITEGASLRTRDESDSTEQKIQSKTVMWGVDYE